MIYGTPYFFTRQSASCHIESDLKLSPLSSPTGGSRGSACALSEAEGVYLSLKITTPHATQPHAPLLKHPAKLNKEGSFPGRRFMPKILIVSLFLLSVFSAQGQSSNQNTVRTRILFLLD